MRGSRSSVGRRGRAAGVHPDQAQSAGAPGAWVYGCGRLIFGFSLFGSWPESVACRFCSARRNWKRAVYSVAAAVVVDGIVAVELEEASCRHQLRRSSVGIEERTYVSPTLMAESYVRFSSFCLLLFFVACFVCQAVYVPYAVLKKAGGEGRGGGNSSTLFFTSG